MLKIIITVITSLIFLPFIVHSAEGPNRFRVYGSSTSASVSECSSESSASGGGYAVHYIFSKGLGLGISNSNLEAKCGTTSSKYDSGIMGDFSYTWGSTFTFTLGLGVGTAAKYNDEGGTYESNNNFVGFGYDFNGIEVLLGLRKITWKVKYIETEKEDSTEWGSTGIGIGYTF